MACCWCCWSFFWQLSLFVAKSLFYIHIRNWRIAFLKSQTCWTCVHGLMNIQPPISLKWEKNCVMFEMFKWGKMCSLFWKLQMSHIGPTLNDVIVLFITFHTSLCFKYYTKHTQRNHHHHCFILEHVIEAI